MFAQLKPGIALAAAEAQLTSLTTQLLVSLLLFATCANLANSIARTRGSLILPTFH